MSFNSLLAKSLTEHWSIGASGALGHSSYLNQDLYARVGPALEFNFFPYADSSTRQFTVQFGTGVRIYDYVEETIFLKTSDTFWDATVETTLRSGSRGGAVAFGVEASAFVQDWHENQVTGFTNLDLRVTQGSSFRFGGSLASIHDQVFLPRQGATTSQRLARWPRPLIQQLV